MEINKTIIFIIITILILIISNIILKFLKKSNQKIPNEKYYFSKRYLNKVKKYEKENKDINYVDIIFLGDSLFYRYNLKEFYPEFTTLNRGFNGDTTFGVENRLKISCFDVKSKVVIMLIGINNINRMFENYESILIKFKNNINDRKIIICSLTPMSGKLAVKNNMVILSNKFIKKLVEKYNFLFIDLYTPLLNNDTQELYEQYTTDGLHFTHEGYEVITKEIKKVLNKII